MVRTFTGSRPPRNEMDEQEDTQLSDLGLNDFRPMPRNLFVGGAKHDQLSGTDDDERTSTGSTELARTTELEERTRVLEMEMGKILARLIPDDPLIPLLNMDAQPAVVVATRNSPALSNVVVPTKPRGSGRLNPEPNSSKHNEELIKKNADLKRQLKDVQKSIDELKSPRSHQQTLDLDNAPLNLSITVELYQEGFKIPHLETYDSSSDPDEHLHTYQGIMRIQNTNDAMMCKVFPTTLKSTVRRWYHKLPRHSIDSYSQLAKLFSNKFASQRKIKQTATELQVHQKEGESLRDYMQRFNKATLDIDNVLDTICLSTLLHGLKYGQFLDDLLENPLKTWNEGQRYQLDNTQDVYQDNQYPFEQGRAHRGHQFNRWGQGQRTATQNQKDRKRVGYAGIPLPSSTINMISGDIHSGGQSARGRKVYARQVTTVNKNRPLKRPFEEAEWKNAPITFSPIDYKRAEGEPDVMMPHADPFVATVHIGNHNINKKYEGPIYGFDNQPVPVEEVITFPIYVGSEPRFRMASVSFLVVKMELAFNAILRRATLCELKAVISQPHLYMKFPTPQGVGVLKGNQKMVKACYQDTFKKVELAIAPRGSSEIHRPSQPGQQTMSISDIEHRPKGVELKAEPVEPMDTIPLDPDVQERTVKIGTKLTEEERAKLLEFLRVNQDVFAWTTDEMPGILAELIVHKFSTDPTKRPVRMSFLDASLGYHQVQLLLDNQEKTAFYVGVAIYCYVMMPFGMKNVGVTYHKLVQVVFKLQIGRNIEVYVDDVIVTSKRAEDHIDDLNETFRNLRKAQMKLNPLKGTFAMESGKFLGYVVSKKGIEVNPKKVQARSADGAYQDREKCAAFDRLCGHITQIHSQIGKKVSPVLQSPARAQELSVDR
ncbi:hypothetical protein SLEP1_g44424 [Rubroshorea leprosula]|uniref:Reverse transcriptase domain-containing protein n=1 Tax=Rubroshorea leprosula TaxID=152421 RepID=A0AAV5LG48_9ROSI|nr:hypothetical protein SLEP1_g44424 [Rubroshorea leprosula]